MDFLVNPQIRIIFQLFLAALLGGLVGLEREYKRKEAGLKTYRLVSLGACLFTILAFEIYNSLVEKSANANFDPTRMVGQIIVGIGFIGAGLIIFRERHIEGLTTAAGLWAIAAIGIAAGAQLYFLGIFSTFLVLVILAGFRLIEDRIIKKPQS